MKKTLLLFMTLVTANLCAQELPATYATDFKTILESAKKSFKGDQSGSEKVLADKDFDKEYAVKNTFKGAAVSRLVTDKDGVLNHHAQFRAGISKNEALVLLGKFAGATKPLVPAKYKESENVMMKYINNRAYTWSLDSDNFSEVSNHPIITMGLIEKEGVYYIDLTITEPSGF